MRTDMRRGNHKSGTSSGVRAPSHPRLALRVHAEAADDEGVDDAIHMRILLGIWNRSTMAVHRLQHQLKGLHLQVKVTMTVHRPQHQSQVLAYSGDDQWHHVDE